MIVGAGFAGLIAAHLFPRMPIVEARDRPGEGHKALLRFRSPAVGELVGVSFREVTVRKGIWMGGGWVQPNIRAANLYSRKTLGAMLDRSVWSTETVQRWVAPEDLYAQLVEALADRISWNTKVDFRDGEEPLISTAPLPVVLKALGIEHDQDFRHAPISVQRYRVADADVFQTVYFPSPEHGVYRASITGDLLIVEFAKGSMGDWEDEVQAAFGLDISERIAVTPVDSVEQRYGKIAPIEDGPRKALLAQLTTRHNIFSIGRFATWRNLLLDDLVHDAAVVKRLINASDYERRLKAL